MKTFVMIPTYNEKENIKILIDKILKLNIKNLEIVVADDNSPDGTWRIVKEISGKNKKVHLLLRTKDKGRGYAGKDGFIYCLKHGSDVVVEMDADLSHDPKYIPLMLKELKNADLILGSRRIEGGNEVFYVAKTESLVKKFIGKEVFAIKVYTNLPGAVPSIMEVVKGWDNVSSVHEYDVPFVRRYLIDRNITPLVQHAVTGDFTGQKSKVPVFRAERIEQGAETLHSPKVLAFDIETYSPFDMVIDADKNPIIMLSFYVEKSGRPFF